MVLEQTPKFCPSKVMINSIIIWARFPKMLVKYYNCDFLNVIGGLIGRIVKLDASTHVA